MTMSESLLGNTRPAQEDNMDEGEERERGKEGREHMNGARKSIYLGRHHGGLL